MDSVSVSSWQHCGVSLGLVWFVLNWGNLQGQGIKPFKYLTDEKGEIIGSTHTADEGAGKKEPLSKKEKERMGAIILVSALSVIFWLFYYQAGSGTGNLHDRLCEDEPWLVRNCTVMDHNYMERSAVCSTWWRYGCDLEEACRASAG